MTDPEYAEAHLEATRHLTATVVPDGYEVVVLPVETVDYCAKEWGSSPGRMSRVSDACREAIARRQPATEQVPWWEAVGRVVPDVGTIREVGMSGDQAWVRCGDYDPDGVAPDGTVEVLREDGDA
jgi:hypothetical protein